MAAHIDEVEVVIAEIGTPSVLGLCEIWLNKDNDTLYCLPGYSILSNPRTGKTGGGFALMVSEAISFKERPDLQISKSDVVEAIFVEIDLALYMAANPQSEASNLSCND